jgi:hypothetical protein
LTTSYDFGSFSARDEDIIAFDGQNFSMLFDGSDVGISGDVNAIHIIDETSILLSFTNKLTLPVVGEVDDSDIVLFTATSLGSNTAGSFSLYFDGSDVGLTTNQEEIDAMTVLSDGRIIISTTGNVTVTGASGTDEDLIAFTPAPDNSGDVTTGTWAMYFDGSDVELSESTEDTNGVYIDVNGDLYLSTNGSFIVTGISGQSEDVFICQPISIGDNTACNYLSAPYFDGTAWGLTGEVIDALDL